jgi:hypothetical protein
MHVVGPHDFARALRRRERWRAFPYFATAALLLLGGAVATWFHGWLTLVGVITCAGFALAYLGQYLHDIVRGRSVDPVAGAITLALPTITIVAGERTTGFSIADVAKARHIVNLSFDDLKGLADVLELELISGPTLRVPATFTGFDALLRELPIVEQVDVT